MNIKGPTDFILMPMLAIFFGLLVFFLGVRREMDGGKALWKWAGIGILALGAFTAWSDFSQYAGFADPLDVELFRSQYDGKKNAVSIVGGFMMPVLAIAGCVIADLVIKRRSTRVEED